MQTIYGQPSFRVATDTVEAWITRSGGHLAPITFRLGDRNICPMHVAPWADEGWAAAPDPGENGAGSPSSFPPSLRVLRGDYFCMPFGGNASPFNGEQYPLHGETANGIWSLAEADNARIALKMNTTIRPGSVKKEIHLIPGHSVVYSRHTITGMEGPMTMAHHAMLRCQTEGFLSVSPFHFGQTFPGTFEDPRRGGYSFLSEGGRFKDLSCVPARDGSEVDLSRYPARRGFEDFVMMFADPALAVGWSVVVFPAENYLWFTLKDPKVLTGTALWISNGGRHYAPWNGRHVNVLGIEEVTSSVATGIADSVGDNDAAVAGCRTYLDLTAQVATVVNTLFGIAEIPEGFDRVVAVDFEGDRVVFHSQSGLQAWALVDLSHISG